MNSHQIIPINLAQLLGMTPPQTQEESPPKYLDPQIVHTREQLRSLLETINCAESLTKQPDRPEEDAENQPTVMVSDEHSADSASAIIMAAANRMISIINDDSRWKNAPGGIEKSLKDKHRDAFNADTSSLEKRQEIDERRHRLSIQKKIENAKVSAFCKDIKKNGVPSDQQSPEN